MAQFLSEEAPGLQNFSFPYKKINGAKRTVSIQIMIAVHMILLVGGQGIGAYILINMRGAIEKLKANMTTRTHQLQKLIFVSVVMECMIVASTMTIPLTISGIMLIFPVPYGHFVCNIVFIFMSFQTTCGTVAQFYFIKPFRSSAKRVFFGILNFCQKVRLNRINAWASTVVQPTFQETFVY